MSTPFRGFKFKYPTYSVVTPQTGTAYDVRSLNVSEVSKLKNSATTPTKATESINKCIFDALENSPPEVKDYDSFKKQVTVRDRDALLYGLYHSTFGNETDFNVTCKQCANKQDIKVNISQMFNMNSYPGSDGLQESYKLSQSNDVEPDDVMEEAIKQKNAGKETTQPLDLPEPPVEPSKPLTLSQPPGLPESNIDVTPGSLRGLQEAPEVSEEPVVRNQEPTELDLARTMDLGSDILLKKVQFELPVSNVVVTLRQPTLHDEEQMMSSVPFSQRAQIDIIYETLIIERFDQYAPGQTIPMISVTERQEIIMAYRSLPPRDQIKLIEKFRDEFGQYGIDLKAVWNCTQCGSENDLGVEISSQFFRMVALV